MSSITQSQGTDVVPSGVGDETCGAEPFGGVKQGELGSGMWPFPASDRPGAVWPRGEVDERGERGDRCASRILPSASITGCQSSSWTRSRASPVSYTHLTLPTI